MHVDLSGVVAVEVLEARAQLGLRVLTILSIAHEGAKFIKVELVVRISVSNREADCILPHPHIEGLLLDVGNVVVLHLQ